MNIFVYSDESGVFDYIHEDYYIFGGIILLGKDQKNDWEHKYAHAEKTIRKIGNYDSSVELKATRITNGQKSKLFRSLNNCHKFGVIISQKNVLKRIYLTKKDKQRYLDFAYKIALKRAFQNLIDNSILNPTEVDRLYCFADEHTTATNGRYELREALEQEFKVGTYNWKYDRFFEPIFPSMQEVNLSFCNSKSKLLVRSADIVANRIYYLAQRNMMEELKSIQNLYVSYLP